MTNADDFPLPELPEFQHFYADTTDRKQPRFPLFTEQQMQAYARATLRSWLAAHPGQGGAVPLTGRTHILKTDPVAFDAVAAWQKTHEIRFNDRDYRVGDKLVLKRTQYSGWQMKDGSPLIYTGEECERVVSHILTGYGLETGWAILSFATPPAPAVAEPVEWVKVPRNVLGFVYSALCEESSVYEDSIAHVDESIQLLEALGAKPGNLSEAPRLLAMLAASPAQPAGEREPLTVAARDVLAERQRQISAEGWTPEHDDEHATGEMANAAACYALHTEPVGNVGDYLRFWPWASGWWKPKERRRNLVRAGALILAEIERLDRAGITPKEGAT